VSFVIILTFNCKNAKDAAVANYNLYFLFPIK